MSKRILVVDDAAFARLQLKMVFEQNGAVVVGEAGNGKECLKQYEILKPDLVTMDITMPDMDGITALRLLKEKHPEAKVVMCSAISQPDKFIQSIEAGAMDFIVKPYKVEKIISILQALDKKK